MPGFQSKKNMSLSRMSDEFTQEPITGNWGLNRARGWKLKICWIPKKCFISKKPLWGKQAYNAQRIITGPGDPVIEDYWIDRNEFIIWNLKDRHV
jgi:hypothetical protein